MNNLEGEKHWTEVPERREDWVLVEVGKETVERLNSLIDYLREYGISVVDTEGDKMRGTPHTPFLVKAFIGENDDPALTISLPEGDRDSEISTVRVGSRELSSNYRYLSIGLGRRDDKTIGLQEHYQSVDLAKNPQIALGVRNWLRFLLLAREVQVEVGQIVYSEVHPGQLEWRLLKKSTF